MDKKPTIFNLIKRIMTSKDKWEDIPEDERLLFNNYLTNKILSMNEDYIEVVNYIQKNTWILKPKYLYKLYVDIIPKGYVFSKYIKNTNKKEYNLDQVNAISKYYNISTKNAKEYIDMLPKDEVERITYQIN